MRIIKPIAITLALILATQVIADENSVVLAMDIKKLNITESNQSPYLSKGKSPSKSKEHSVNSVSKKSNVKVSKLEPEEKPKLPPLFVYKNESYKSAISRWFYNAGYKQIAWSISGSMDDQLSYKSQSDKTYEGGLIASITKLSKEIEDRSGKKFYVSFNDRTGAVHEWGNRHVRISMIRGKTLKDVVKNLVKDYRFNWSEQSSWRLDEGVNYEGFAIPFPIVSPADDIMFALNRVLQGRSVQAGVHAGTRTVFIYKSN